MAHILIQKIGETWACWASDTMDSRPPEGAYKNKCYSAVKNQALAKMRIMKLGPESITILQDAQG